jgi:hypothetical protein
MEPLGKTARQAIERAEKLSQTKPSNSLVNFTGKELPPIFDPIVDRELQKLISFRHLSGRIELRRALTTDERKLTQARYADVTKAIESFSTEREASEVKLDLMAMFAGFRNMRQQDDSSRNTVMILMGLLREFPAWAIRKACLKIVKDSDADRDPRWPPNDSEILKAVRVFVDPYRESGIRAQKLLEARVE